MKLALSCLAGTFLALSSAFAQYPAAKLNRNLKEEVDADRNRLIKNSEYFSFAVDGTTSFRHLEDVDYFHGVNYWLQLRTEARPSSLFKLNLRSIFYAGSISYGYREPAANYHLLGISGVFPEKIFDGELSMRILDLDRQTTGRGLLIQDEEFNGVDLKWKRGSALFQIRGDGTGVYRPDDDTLNTEFSLFAGGIGMGTLLWAKYSDYHYVFSTQPLWVGGSYDLEMGTRGGTYAVLGAINHNNETDMLRARQRIEARSYGPGFGVEFSRNASQLYISYDQLDKSFTNITNLWSYGDSANVAAAHVDLIWNPKGTWRVESQNEVGKFFLRSDRDFGYYFFRHGVQFCPLRERDDCLDFFYSNKIITENFVLSGGMQVDYGIPLFTQYHYFGIEGNFRF